MASARNGFFWWEIDVTWYALMALEKLGIVWSLREPPPALLERSR
jgi:stearoyl-CoA desaturase (delta-9 desaturase)